MRPAALSWWHSVAPCCMSKSCLAIMYKERRRVARWLSSGSEGEKTIYPCVYMPSEAVLVSQVEAGVL